MSTVFLILYSILNSFLPWLDEALVPLTEKERLEGTIQKRLGLGDQKLQVIKGTPKFQRLFANALESARYRPVA
jgi:hypothetical protein